MNLPLELERFIRDMVRSGRFASESGVVAEALRLLQAKERCLDQLRRDVQAGIDSGPSIPASEAFDLLQRKVETLACKDGRPRVSRADSVGE